MRLVIATTVDDLMGEIFWRAYRDAGGPQAEAIFLIPPRRPRSMARSAAEALLLFGPLGAARAWQAARLWREVLLGEPQRIFPGAEITHTPSLNRGEGLERLKRIAPSLLVSVGSPEIFKRVVLDLPAIGAVNVHNGRLPAFRGLFGTFWEMRFGEAIGWTSIHQMVPRVDAGPVIAHAAVVLAGRSLHAALESKKKRGGRLLAQVVQYVQQEGKLPPVRVTEAVPSAYYGWPSWRDLLAFRVAALRNGRRPALEVPQSWSPEVRGDEA